MIYWAPFLHFYQPPIQFHAVLKKICQECYRPLLKMFLEHPSSKVTINICGVLTELLNDHGAEDILSGIKELAQNKQLEFVESAKYHPILPLLPKKEIYRQIKLNRQTNEYFFKNAYKPRGFFPPEMCYSHDTASVIRGMEYEWILVSGIACQDEWPLDYIPDISLGASTIKIFFRDDILSNKISFHHLDAEGFIKELIGLAKGKKDIYVVTAMDAETFGHHIHNWEQLFLAEVYKTIAVVENTYHEDTKKQKRPVADAHKEIFTELKDALHDNVEVATISELIKKFPARNSKPPKPSSWSTTAEDISHKNYYPLWKDIGNDIHDLQWEHINICLELIERALSSVGDNKESHCFALFARGLLDKGIHSCQLWWANKNRGMWNINLINKGLLLQEEALLNAYKALFASSADDNTRKDFYHKISAARATASKIRDLIVTQ